MIASTDMISRRVNMKENRNVPTPRTMNARAHRSCQSLTCLYENGSMFHARRFVIIASVLLLLVTSPTMPYIASPIEYMNDCSPQETAPDSGSGAGVLEFRGSAVIFGTKNRHSTKRNNFNLLTKCYRPDQ